MIKRIILLLSLVLMLASPALAEEFFPPQGDGKGVIGGRNGEAWRSVIADTLTVNTSMVGVGVTGTSEIVTAANVITAAECGTTFYLNSATEFASTLPALSAVSAGCEFNFIVKAAAAAANYTVLSGNSLENLIHGLISVNSTMVACATEDTITLVDGNAIGDHIRLRSDGAAWYLTGETLTAAKLTCTQAD